MNIYRERLEKLATHLETGKLGHKKFDFSKFNYDEYGFYDENHCGSVGCAIGECPFVFPNDWFFSENNKPVIYGKYFAGDSGEEYFSLSPLEFNALFIHGEQNRMQHFKLKSLFSSATKEEVATNIRAFLSFKKWEGE